MPRATVITLEISLMNLIMHGMLLSLMVSGSYSTRRGEMGTGSKSTDGNWLADEFIRIGSIGTQRIIFTHVVSITSTYHQA